MDNQDNATPKRQPIRKDRVVLQVVGVVIRITTVNAMVVSITERRRMKITRVRTSIKSN